MKTRLCLFLVTFLALNGVPVWGQASGSTQTVPSSGADNPALATVRQAVAAMGGEAWAAVGGATAQLSVTDGREHTAAATSSDDWSKGTARKRNDSIVGSSATPLKIVGAGAVSVSVLGDKTVHFGPAPYDLVMLAELYPAAALRLALSRADCRFMVAAPGGHMTGEDIGSVELDCGASGDSFRHAQLFWKFDGSGVLQSVRVPMPTAIPNVPSYRTFRFRGFQQLQGLTVPTAVETVSNGHVLQTAVLSDVSFQASLSDELFSAVNAQQQQ